MTTVGKIQEWINYYVGLSTILAIVSFVAFILSLDSVWCLFTIIFLILILCHPLIETAFYRYAKEENESEKLVRESDEFMRTRN